MSTTADLAAQYDMTIEEYEAHILASRMVDGPALTALTTHERRHVQSTAKMLSQTVRTMSAGMKAGADSRTIRKDALSAASLALRVASLLSEGMPHEAIDTIIEAIEMATVKL